MIKASKILLIYLILFNVSFAEELLSCTTKKHSGLFFLGGDYLKILEYLGLDKFSIKLSRNRVEIIDNQNEIQKRDTNIKRTKNVHFLELILIKSNNYPIIFHCSWRHRIGVDKITNDNFECVEQKKKKDLFSLSYNGDFSYSSEFQLHEKKEPLGTLHSIFGKCNAIKN